MIVTSFSSESHFVSLYKDCKGTSFVVPVAILAASVWIFFEFLFLILGAIVPGFTSVFQ